MGKQSSTTSSSVSTNTLIFLGIGWAIISLIFFLFFSVPPVGEERADWYLNGITILETGAFLASSLLCFRNWQSKQIVSGRNVWLWICLGLFCYTAGNVLFYIWGNVWGLDPAVSLGDLFYLSSYVFLAGGMLQAVLPRRLNLEIRQWVIVFIIGALGIALAIFFNFFGPSVDEEETPPPAEAAVEQVVPETLADAPEGSVPGSAPPEAASAPEVAEETADASTAPALVRRLDTWLEPSEFFVTLLYVAGDCFLLAVAATLLVAFWGGRFSQSWKLIAIAAFCLYIADMFFALQVDYQEGDLWEVFWTFSAVFFGLGAIVEHTISSRSRRTSRRRRA